MEKCTLLCLWILVTLTPTLALPTLSLPRCMRRMGSKCSWDCTGDRVVLNFRKNYKHVSVQCDTGNTYTIGLCGDVHCKGEPGVMACSNVTGPKMFLSNVKITIDYNEEQPNKSQINFLSDDSFFIALSEGSAEDNACFASAENVYQAFLFEEQLFVPLWPLTPAKQSPGGTNVARVNEGLGTAVFSGVVILIVCIGVFIYVYFKCRRSSTRPTRPELTERSPLLPHDQVSEQYTTSTL